MSTARQNLHARTRRRPRCAHCLARRALAREASHLLAGVRAPFTVCGRPPGVRALLAIALSCAKGCARCRSLSGMYERRQLALAGWAGDAERSRAQRATQDTRQLRLVE